MKNEFYNLKKLKPRRATEEIMQYVEQTHDLDSVRRKNLKKISEYYDRILNSIIPNFRREVRHGLSSQQTRKINKKLAEKLYSEDLSRIIYGEEKEEFKSFVRDIDDTLLTYSKQNVAEYLVSNGIFFVLLRPEMRYQSASVIDFFKKQGCKLIFRSSLQLKIDQYVSLYRDSIIKPEGFEDFPTRTLQYFAEKCEIIFFSLPRNKNYEAMVKLKGQRGVFSHQTLRGDLVIKEAFANLNLTHDKYEFDPILAYEHILSGETKSDLQHEQVDFGYIFYSYVGIHMADEKDLSRELATLMSEEDLVAIASEFFTMSDKVIVFKLVGTENIVYKINYRKGTCFVKLATNSQGTKKIFAETFVLNKFIHNPHFPNILASAQGLIATSSLTGESLDDQIDMYKNTHIFDHLSRDLKKIHSVKLCGFGNLKPTDKSAVGILKKWSEYFVDVEKKINNLIKKDIVSHRDGQELMNYWKNNFNILDSVKSGRLIHGDFCLDHIFVKNNKYCGIIDFSDAISGDPLMDLAYFKLKEINKLYGQLVYQNLVSHYCKLSQAEEIKLNLYMVYWLIERLYCDDAGVVKAFNKKLAALLEALRS